jgi:TM2 domain-containing membrane protein YozV
LAARPARAREEALTSKPGAAIPACLLAWLFPGAGHFYLGRPFKGLVFLVAIGTLFVLGVACDARLDLHLGLDDLMASIVSLSQVAAGLPYFVARLLGFESGQATSLTFDYGITYTATAGLLNVLVILDAHDTARGRKA